ncbi:MAG TPA: hypothetical protein VHM00_17755 [Caldimonas sp.]|jgi:hypothetical protein|nr:hypothetical protein [Caldimonas sp.]HEX2542913.1 hypothetical protein [Caldimonas sp.]
MHRYYMTPETRQALIAESNRQIASRSASRHGALDSEPGADSDASGDDSAFARLVADLQSVSSGSRSQ